MEDNIQELETKIENIIVGEVQPTIKKSVGRPRKPVDETTPKKKEYYIKKNMYIMLKRILNHLVVQKQKLMKN